MVLALSDDFPKTVVQRSFDRGLVVAVAGCGYWGSKHVRVLSTLPNVSEIVVADPDDRARAATANAFPNATITPSISAAIYYADAVVVATPPHNHAAIALEAVRSGKHVLIEKPLATTLHDARMLVHEATRNDVVLMVGHTFEFNAGVQELRRRMDAGELGEIRYIHSARLNLGLYRSDVNVIWDLAPHDISIMNYLLRSTPTLVRAWGSANSNPQVVDLAYFQLEYRNSNVVGYGHVSWLDPRKVRQITVVGSRKMAVYDDLAEERLRIYDRGVDLFSASDVANKTFHKIPYAYRYGDIISPYIKSEEPLVLEDQHFIDCIRNRCEPASDGTSGINVIAALEAIDRSLKTGGSVELEESTAYPFAPALVAV
jgi:predicted dehydrogenase